jgi:hypothetical protein
MTSNRVMAQIRVQGSVTGVVRDRVWVAAKDHAWSINAATNTADTEIPLSCAPREWWSTYVNSLMVGTFGVWLGCATPAHEKKSSFELPGFLRRLDAETGDAVAELELPRPFRTVAGDATRMWARDADRTACRLHEIDPTTNRLLRTLVVGRFECVDLVVAGDDGWMTTKVRTEIIKVDLRTGRVVGTVTIAGRRLAKGLAIMGDAVWVSTGPEWDLFGAAPGSLGVLLRIDRATAQMTHAIPTATADRLIGVQGDTAWLYDWAGAVVKVASKPRRRRAL